MEAGGHACSALLHESGGLRVLELEPLSEEDADDEEGALVAVNRLVSPLARARGAAALLQEAADAMRGLTGFDRVTVYRFDADWNGEVWRRRRAAWTVPGPALPGQRHPRAGAASCTAQLAAPHRRRGLRAGRRWCPPLHPGAGAPLDLSGAALRSVSPIHLEYLRNMGVGASFSVSLLSGASSGGSSPATT